VPFKRFITLLQIAQFILDIINALPWPIYKLRGQTRGDWGPIFFGHFIAFTYTILFSRVYLRIRRQSLEKKQRGKKEDTKKTK